MIKRNAVLGAAVLAMLLAAFGCDVGVDDSTHPYRTGKRLYETQCTKCHARRTPWDYGEDEWPSLVSRFAPEAGLTSYERDRVLEYLLYEVREHKALERSKSSK